MNIAIHHRVNSFSEEWIRYCEEKNISYKIVNCYDNNIIEQLRDVDILMWHHHHDLIKDVVSAQAILFSIAEIGVKVFPNYNTSWYFDDKVSQKYLFESLSLPSVNSYVFYDKDAALSWLKSSELPVVFKLKRGAGSRAVRLIKTKKQGRRIIRKAFSKGISEFDKWSNFIDQYKKVGDGKASVKTLLYAVKSLFVKPEYVREKCNEKGYVYFQEFLDGNDSDIRVIVIGNKAFAIKRMVRANDFRASGSGAIMYAADNFNKDVLNEAFKAAEKLKSQCAAFDFIYDSVKKPKIVEVSYGFTMSGYKNCEGYWDNELNFFKGGFNPYGWMIEGLISELDD